MTSEAHLTYVGDETPDAPASVYKLTIDGAHVADVLVDHATLAIVFANPERTKCVATKGVAVVGTHEVADPDSLIPAGIHTHIVSDSVRSYVYPRALHLVVALHLAS
jgi:hypothetical protein